MSSSSQVSARCVQGIRFALVALACLSPVSARAQSGRAYASFVPAATVFEGNTSLALSGTFGVQLNGAVGFEIEFTGMPGVDDLEFGVLPAQLQALSIFPIPRYQVESRAMMFVTSARVFIPTTVPRATPFFVAGGGLAHVRQSISYDFGLTPGPLGTTQSGLGTLPTEIPSRLLLPYYNVGSEVALALTLGGGVRIDVGKGVSVDADLRYFRLLAQQDRNLGRFGVGVGYRF
jgi:hypothetical protein